MFYLVGLGLGDAKDITMKGLEIVRKSHTVYLEAYTSVLSVGKDVLEKFYGREVVLADREAVEHGAEEMLREAVDRDVVLLVVGDPFGATTHSDLILRARALGISCQVVHNASILTAVGCCGLQLYSFGETVSIVFWTETWNPESFYDKITRNRSMGLHTLCLLDIKMKEQTVENMMRGRRIFEPPRFMSVRRAAEQLLDIVQRRREQGDGNLGKHDLTENTICVGLARVGATDQQLAAGPLAAFIQADLGPPLHSLIVTGHLHPLEWDMLSQHALPGCNRPEPCEDHKKRSSMTNTEA
uniref:diphthine methyl ester synthase n=1 Tax=Eptatretus burgeri TaxID=7764 RepID=A0A8C4RCX7_EPTBU